MNGSAAANGICNADPCGRVDVGDRVKLRAVFTKIPEPNRGPYVAGTVYALGDVVEFGCDWYVATCAGALGSPP
jgi:hypothetical protein